MLTEFNLPSDKKCDIKVYNYQSAGTQVWYKPPNATMVFIQAIGGGGGGGGGHSAAAATARGGGGGGGSSGHASILYPAFFIPDRLYILVGAGGAGGAATANGSPGSNTFIAMSDPYNGTLSQISGFLTSGSTVPGGGIRGTAAAVGAGGAAGVVVPSTAFIHSAIAIYNFSAGQAGAAGGAVAGAVGANTTISVAGQITQGGGGGAGTTSADFAGGGITEITNSLISQNRPLRQDAGSVPGFSGFLLQKPFFSYAGAGGSSSNSGVGGNGGDGGPGSGGGGGGGGTTGGAGGKGGDGLVIIISW
jgi:hypothetical protein